VAGGRPVGDRVPDEQPADPQSQPIAPNLARGRQLSAVALCLKPSSIVATIGNNDPSDLIQPSGCEGS
jgi:hypothetical protein